MSEQHDGQDATKDKIVVVPKLIGFDGECGNFIVGSGRTAAVARPAPTNYAASPTYYGATGYLGGTDDKAASMLLKQIAGVRTKLAKKRDKRAKTAGSKKAKKFERGVDATNSMWYRDYGRKWLTNGGCAYIDCAKLELCTPIVRSALDHVKYVHALFRMTKMAAEACRPDVERDGKTMNVILNNSDGHGNSWGTHINMLVTKECWENIFERKLQYLLYLASYQVTSIIFTGQGKVGVEKDSGFSGSTYLGSKSSGTTETASESEDAVDFQLSQRADFFKCMVGSQTTYNRPLVNSRDEALCGGAKDMLARMHIIFYDQNLCHTAAFLKVGVLQIILAMIESQAMNPNLILDDPLASVKAISRDPSLEAKVLTAGGDLLTAIEVQLKFLEDAKRFHAEGRLEGVVPMADRIIEAWEDTLLKLQAKDFESLTGSIDWILKKTLLERAISQNGLQWSSPEVKALDHKYADVSDDGLYFTYERAGVTDQLVSEEEIVAAMTDAPEDTRSWLVGEMLKKSDDGEVQVEDVDWDEIEFTFPRDKGASFNGTIELSNPLGHTKADCEAVLAGTGEFEEKLKSLGLEEKSGYYYKGSPWAEGGRSTPNSDEFGDFSYGYGETSDAPVGFGRRLGPQGHGHGQSWSDTEYYKDKSKKIADDEDGPVGRPVEDVD